MEDLENTQYFDKNALPDVVLLDSGENYYNDKGNEYFVEVGDKSNN